MSDHDHEQPTGNPPVYTHRDGALSAKVWRNETHDGRPFYSVTFARTYTDPETDELRESRSFQQTDVLKIQRLAGQAYQTIGQFRAQDREHAQTDRTDGLNDQREAAMNGRAKSQGTRRVSRRKRQPEP